MPSELPPEEDRPAVSIAPPLLFVLPIAAALALERFVPTSFVHGAFRWILGAIFFVAGLLLNIAGFVTQKRAGTDPIPFNPSTRIVTPMPRLFLTQVRVRERKFSSAKNSKLRLRTQSWTSAFVRA